MNQETEHETK